VIASLPAFRFNAASMVDWLGSDSTRLPPQLTGEQG
jgi:hypothetical protein